jgi:hypothetical protein
MHLIDDVVMRIGQCSHGGVGAGRYPSPSTGVGVAFDEDSLRRGTCSTDAVDSGLIQVADKGVVHVMVFIVGVEDNVTVPAEMGRNCLPKSLETSSVRDDVAVVATEVLSTDCCIPAPISMF